MITIFQTVFQNGGGNSQTCGMPFTSVPAAAIFGTATAKAVVLAKTDTSFSRQAT